MYWSPKINEITEASHRLQLAWKNKKLLAHNNVV